MSINTRRETVIPGLSACSVSRFNLLCYGRVGQISKEDRDKMRGSLTVSRHRRSSVSCQRVDSAFIRDEHAAQCGDPGLSELRGCANRLVLVKAIVFCPGGATTQDR